MSIFQDVTIQWDGDEHTIKSGEIMRLIAVLEGEITLQELTNPAGPPFAKLSLAYAALLNKIGVKVGADEVYAALFDSESQAEAISSATTGLLMIMMPPSAYQPKPKKSGKGKAKAK